MATLDENAHEVVQGVGQVGRIIERGESGERINVYADAFLLRAEYCLPR